MATIAPPRINPALMAQVSEAHDRMMVERKRAAIMSKVDFIDREARRLLAQWEHVRVTHPHQNLPKRTLREAEREVVADMARKASRDARQGRYGK